MSATQTLAARQLPGQNCGVCGYRTCDALAEQLESRPDLIKRCINLSDNRVANPTTPVSEPQAWRREAPKPVFGEALIPASPDTDTSPVSGRDGGPASSWTRSQGRGCARPASEGTLDESPSRPDGMSWRDSLGREFDFYLEHFPEDPGPREIILPHNPMLTREMEIKVGDLMIGRPLGMSCGCPITHCGVAVEVDARTGVIVWCVTGPLAPREKGFKDIGYYIAEGYEGLITQTRTEIKIGMRYFFQPRLCMLQWRHSGLVNYVNRSADGLQVRLEGLWIG